MSTSVGSAHIDIDVDASGISDSLVKSMDEALAAVEASAEDSFGAVADSAAASGAAQSEALGGVSLSADEAARASRDLEGAQKALEVGLLAVGAAAIASAGYLVKLGDDFDQMSRTIRVGTGAAGDDLAGLEESAKSVMRTVPNAMGDVGSTLADLNTRLGLTGDDLELVTTQMLELENITGIAPNINSITGALKGYGEGGENASAAIDTLFQVSQATGVGVDELASSLERGGPALREFGFGFEESAAMIGTLDKAGIQGDQVVQRLTRSLGEFAEAGGDPKEALAETVTSIEEYMAVGDRAAAYELAEGLFGTRGAASFIDAVQSGAMNLDDLMGAAGATDDTIIGLAEETRTMGEEFQILKNQAIAELEPYAVALFDTLRDGGAWIMDNVVPALQDMAQWVKENETVVKVAAIAIGGMVTGLVLARGALMAYNTYMRLANIATLLSTKGIKGLNMAMKANVIGLIVGAIAGLVAGLTYFFTQTETGKRIWDSFMDVLRGAWDWLSGVFAGVWSTISEAASSAFEWISEAWSTVWGYLQSAWDSVGAPIFDGIKFAFGVIVTAIELWWEGVKLYWTLVANIIVWAWDTLIKPTFDALKVGLEALGAFFQWVWESVISPVWNALGAGIRWVYDAIIAPTWELLKAALGLVGDAFMFYWKNVIKPTWDALGAGINWVWLNVISPAWDALKAALGAVGDFFQWVWNSVIKPAWDALGDGIRAVLDNVVHPAFEGLKTGLGFVRDAFSTAVDFIGDMWDRIKGITASPIRFVIDTVYNQGIKGVWDKVAGWLGLDPLDPMEMPSALAGYASGGVLPGYTPGRDVHRFINPETGAGLALSGGEAIMRPEFVKAVGGEAEIHRLNRAAINGTMRHPTAMADGGMLHFAGGGLLPGWEKLTSPIQYAMATAVARAFPNQRITSGTRYHDVGAGYDNHMAARAIDFAPSGALASWIASEYPNTLELFWDPGPNMKNGAPTGAIGGHSDHVHWAMAQIPDPYTGDVISHDGPGGSGGTSAIGALVSAAFDKIMNPILNALPDFGGGLWGGLPGALIDKLVEGAKSFFGSKAPSGGGNVTPGSGPVVQQVREAMAAYGWDVEPFWSAIDYIITRESSWDPLATNPSSGAFGLPQFNPMGGNTLGQYLPDRNPNPKVQADAMARYIRNRYGDPLQARAFWEANGWYDDGGVASGKGAMMKNTIKPERVLNPAQTEAFEAWMEAGQKFDEINDLVASVQAMQLDSPEVMADEIGRRVAEWIGEEQEPGSLRALAAALQTGIEWERVVDGMQRSAEAWANGEWVQIADDRRLATPEEMASQVGENFLEEIAGEFGGLIGLNNPYKARSIVDETGTIQLPQEAGGIVPVTGDAPTVKAESGTGAVGAPAEEGTKETINVAVEVNVNGVQDPVAVSDMVVERMGRGIEQAFGGTGRSL